jgi:hypothetical protein
MAAELAVAPFAAISVYLVIDPQPDLPDRPGTPPPTRARANTAMCSDRHCTPPGKQLGEVFGTYRKPAQRLAEQLGYEKNGTRAGRELYNGSRSRAGG